MFKDVIKIFCDSIVIVRLEHATSGLAWLPSALPTPAFGGCLRSYHTQRIFSSPCRSHWLHSSAKLIVHIKTWGNALIYRVPQLN